MTGGEVDWVGVAFTPLHHHDARFFRAPGLYAFVRRCPQHGPLMLFAGQAENLAQEATPSHPVWPEALRLRMEELHICQPIPRRVDRLQLLSRIVTRVQPIMNVIAEAHPAPEPLPARWRA